MTSHADEALDEEQDSVMDLVGEYNRVRESSAQRRAARRRRRNERQRAQAALAEQRAQDEIIEEIQAAEDELELALLESARLRDTDAALIEQARQLSLAEHVDKQSDVLNTLAEQFQAFTGARKDEALRFLRQSEGDLQAALLTFTSIVEPIVQPLIRNSADDMRIEGESDNEVAQENVEKADSSQTDDEAEDLLLAQAIAMSMQTGVSAAAVAEPSQRQLLMQEQESEFQKALQADKERADAAAEKAQRALVDPDRTHSAPQDSGDYAVRFSLPDGTRVVYHFESSATVADLRAVVRQKLLANTDGEIASFGLKMPFADELDWSARDATLAALQLPKRAALVVEEN